MSAAQQPQDPLIGRTIDGRYELLARLGEGGMGVVYQARQVSVDRLIAIKMLHPQLAQDPTWAQRFNNEAKACSRLQHPNTIRLFDFGQTREGRLFMTMEFLDGLSLRQAIAAGAPMAAVRVLKILIQCCASLTEAHGIGIVHRDIKPDNVFLLNLAGSPDFVKLLDFSVAKLLQDNEALRTRAGVVFGTPQYMSPEQARGAPLDARSDLYSLGILAYEMLTGRPPFSDQNPMRVLQMHKEALVPQLPQEIPQDMRTVVMRALEKTPDQRYQTATAMMQECQQAFASIGAQAAGMAPLSARAKRASAAPVPRPQKTLIATDQQLGHAPPAANAPAPQKTLLADQVSAPLGGPPEPQKTMMAHGQGLIGGPPPAADATPPPGFEPPNRPPARASSAQPEQKTLLADAGALGQLRPPEAPQGKRAPSSAPLPGPQRTMLLDDSEGVVSFARPADSAPVGPTGHIPVPPDAHSVNQAPASGGASAMFWIVCLLTGLSVGVLAYLAVLKLGS